MGHSLENGEFNTTYENFVAAATNHMTIRAFPSRACSTTINSTIQVVMNH